MAMAKSDAQWRAEGDAETLGRAEEIKSDRPRLGKAKVAATRLAKEKLEDAQNIQKVASAKPTVTNNPPPKAAPRKRPGPTGASKLIGQTW